MAWRNGADPFQLYNSLDSEYRPLTDRQECPACYATRRSGNMEPCALCQWRGYVEIPRATPGEPTLPSHPRRLRSLLYGFSVGLREMDAKAAGGRVRRSDPRTG